jgi:hypothetical protein
VQFASPSVEKKGSVKLMDLSCFFALAPTSFISPLIVHFAHSNRATNQLPNPLVQEPRIISPIRSQTPHQEHGKIRPVTRFPASLHELIYYLAFKSCRRPKRQVFLIRAAGLVEELLAYGPGHGIGAVAVWLNILQEHEYFAFLGAEECS